MSCIYTLHNVQYFSMVDSFPSGQPQKIGTKAYLLGCCCLQFLFYITLSTTYKRPHKTYTQLLAILLQLLFREDATVDDLIDVIEGNRKYMKCIYVYNKIDVIGIDDVDNLARQPNSVVISCNLEVDFTFLNFTNFDCGI